MTTAPQAFDAHQSAYKEHQTAPWGRLLYGIASANLQRHMPTDSLRILDAGGGNGVDSVPLASQGHHVTLLDYSPEMLAEARRNAEASGVSERLAILQSDFATIPTIFPEPTFDVVLCHNVIQYVDDMRAALQSVLHVLRPGGLFSLISLNRFSEAYRSTFRDLDLDTAYAALDTHTFRSLMFDASTELYSVGEMSQCLADIGFSVVTDYGIRCVCDYILDNEIKSDPAFFSRLEKLELALTDRYPYKLLARFFQIIARKTRD